MRKQSYFNNNRNHQRVLQQQVEWDVPAIYASIALALHKHYGFGYKRLTRIFLESQELWENNRSDIMGMVLRCYRDTGIICMDEKQRQLAIKKGWIE